jgi:hypothetical protein
VGVDLALGLGLGMPVALVFFSSLTVVVFFICLPRLIN